MHRNQRKRRRLLVITPYPVVPPVAGGKVRSYAPANQLARLGLEVTLLTPFYSVPDNQNAPGRDCSAGANIMNRLQILWIFGREHIAKSSSEQNCCCSKRRNPRPL